ncbi:ABC transporter permease [uncultured Bacteroides sp.]|uniref:ABC transporter permease n=1 Tax=uncultured Bacteroides sp. TaxID=162156 RepID=UPI0025DB8B18|nr:ABC transporter permease [uncultured Bacteroides sp.]
MTIRVYWKQAWNLLKQHPLFSTLYIVGTGTSIVMTMIIAIVYYVRLAPVYPETNRMRTLVVKSVKMRQEDMLHSSGVSYAMLKEWFYSLKSVEACTGVSGTRYARVTNGKEELPTYARYTDEHFFRVFPLVFLEGKPFTEADRRSGLPNVVLTDTYAQQLFGTAKGVVGRTFLLDYTDVKVAGVVRSGSFLTPDSYAQVYLPYSCRDGYDKAGMHWALGHYSVYLLLKESASTADVRDEVQELVRKFNASDTGEGWKLDLTEQPEPYWQRVFRYERDTSIDWGKVIWTFVGVFMVLLFVPAFNLGGMISARVQRQLPDLGVCKAFGASRSRLLVQIIGENLLLTGLGTAFGLIIAWIVLTWAGHTIFSLFEPFPLIPPEGADLGMGVDMLFAPTVFAVAALFCLLLNLISALIPAWNALNHPIVESLNEQK